MKKELNEIGNVFTTDILIIGGGLGGTITAAKVHELNPSAQILLVEKGYYGYAGQNPNGVSVFAGNSTGSTSKSRLQ